MAPDGLPKRPSKRSTHSRRGVPRREGEWNARVQSSPEGRFIGRGEGERARAEGPGLAWYVGAVNPHSPRAGRRPPGARPAFTLAISLGTAAALGLVLYVASTSLPYLASAATADPRFGSLNQCLLETLAGPRVGFAVSADGARAASFGAGAVAVCARAEADGGMAAGRKLALKGVVSAAFDFDGNLWLAASGEAGGDPQLWRLAPEGGEPVRLGAFSPLALVGHARGVAAVDGAGRLVSLAAGGEALGFHQLPGVPAGGVHLAVNADGTLIAVAAGTGLFVLRAAGLELLRAEAPCRVEFAWWLQEPGRVLVACGPQGSWALSVQVATGEQEAAPDQPRIRSVLLPRLGAYVQDCDHLPCTAPAP